MRDRNFERVEAENGRGERGERALQNWSSCKERGNGKGEKENAEAETGKRERQRRLQLYVIEQRVRGKERLKKRERRGWQDRSRGKFRAITTKRGRTQASRERGKTMEWDQ